MRRVLYSTCHAEWRVWEKPAREDKRSVASCEVVLPSNLAESYRRVDCWFCAGVLDILFAPHLGPDISLQSCLAALPLGPRLGISFGFCQESGSSTKPETESAQKCQCKQSKEQQDIMEQMQNREPVQHVNRFDYNRNNCIFRRCRQTHIGAAREFGSPPGSAGSQVVNSTAQASTTFLTLNPRPKPWLTSIATDVCFKG